MVSFYHWFQKWREVVHSVFQYVCRVYIRETLSKEVQTS